MKNERESRSARALRRAGMMGALVVLAGSGTPLRAQTPDSATPQARAADTAAADSPRAVLERYLRLAREGNYEAAGRYLDASGQSAPAAALARRLKAVLDRHLWFDLQRVSGASSGDTTDGLTLDTEHLGVIAGADGVRRPVRLTRSPVGTEPAWRFSATTVAAIEPWYRTLGNRWVLEHVPTVLQRPGPFEILWWQWIALPLLLVLAWTVGAPIGRVVRAILGRGATRTSATWDDRLIARLGAPITLILTLAIFSAVLPFLSLVEPAADALYRLVRAGYFIIVFWIGWRVIDVVREVIAATPWALSTTASRALLPLGARVVKAVLVAIAVVATLSMLGYPVASLVAGLGIGGLALALAAQKTVENLFGAFSIGVDQPFTEGDFVRVQDFVGTVEKIGLRSTRFRTLDRTLITIPNGQLADSRLETFATRDRIRLDATIGLVYDTTAAQMRDVLQGFERTLREHPKIWPDAVTVRFKELASSSLDIQVMAWFQTRDFAEFLLIRQEVLLEFMDVMEKAGTSIAFPTQTIHVVPASDSQ